MEKADLQTDETDNNN